MLLSFDAVLHAPHAGERGTLQAASADGNPWSAQQPVTLAKAGENVVTLQVALPLLLLASTALVAWDAQASCQAIWGHACQGSNSGHAWCRLLSVVQYYQIDLKCWPMQHHARP